MLRPDAKGDKTKLSGTGEVDETFVSLVATGAWGPDYTLWVSTNLTSWQILFTSNSPVIPVTLMDTHFSSYPSAFIASNSGRDLTLCKNCPLPGQEDCPCETSFHPFHKTEGDITCPAMDAVAGNQPCFWNRYWVAANNH